MKTAEKRIVVNEPPRRSSGIRRVLIALLSFGAIGAIIAVAVASRSGGDALAELRVRGDLVDVVRGETVREEGVEGKDLIEGDVIRTNETGQAQIDLFDGSVIRLDSATAVGLRELSDTADGRDVSISLGGGRVWNRVAEMRSADDRYVLKLGDATVSVTGTTFFVDCRQPPSCFAVGVDGTSEVASGGDEMALEEDDCIEIVPEAALDRCNAKKLRLMDDWVKENLAEDQQLELAEVKVAPTSTPTATTSGTRARAPVPQPAAPAPTASPEPEPKATKEPTPEPKKDRTFPPTAEPTPGQGPGQRTPTPKTSPPPPVESPPDESSPVQGP